MSTYAGTGTSGSSDGPASTASFNAPDAISFDEHSRSVYVAESRNYRIRKISANSMTLSSHSQKIAQEYSEKSSCWLGKLKGNFYLILNFLKILTSTYSASDYSSGPKFWKCQWKHKSSPL